MRYVAYSFGVLFCARHAGLACDIRTDSETRSLAMTRGRAWQVGHVCLDPLIFWWCGPRRLTLRSFSRQRRMPEARRVPVLVHNACENRPILLKTMSARPSATILLTCSLIAWTLMNVCVKERTILCSSAVCLRWLGVREGAACRQHAQSDARHLGKQHKDR